MFRERQNVDIQHLEKQGFRVVLTGVFIGIFLAFPSAGHAASNDDFEKYFPTDQYPSYSSTQEGKDSNEERPDNFVGGIKNLSAEIQKSVKEVAQKRNLTCFGDPCLFQFFPLVYTRPESGFFGGVRLNLTNISRRDPYFYAANIQIIRSDSKQWLTAANFDIPIADFKVFKPRVKLRGSYARSTEFRYNGEGSASYSFAKRPERDKRYSLNERSAGTTVLIPLWIYSKSQFGLYTSYDYSVVKIDPYFSNGSILFSQKPTAYEGGTYRSLGMGIYNDTRDSEFFTRSGEMLELGIGLGALDENQDVVYRANLSDRRYYSKGRWTLAHRLTLDGLFGEVPFWEKTSVGGIDPIRDINGSGLLKGAPDGRFHENIKLMEAVEVRLHQNEFKAFGQRGNLALVPIAAEIGLLGRLGVWSISTGLDILWNKSFLTRFYTSFSEGNWELNLKFTQDF